VTPKRVAAVLAAAAMLVVGCGEGTPGSGRSDLRVAVREVPSMLNPLLSSSFEEQIISDLVFDGLFNRSGASSDGVEPGAALSIEQATGANTHVYYVKLDGGKEWHDSRASVGGGCGRSRSASEHVLGAEDVLFTWRCIASQANRSPLADRAGAIIRTIEKDRSGRGDLRIEFVRPIYVGWAQEELAYFKIVPLKTYGEPLTEDLLRSDPAQRFNEHPVGTGPYEFAGKSGNSVYLSSVGSRSIETIEFRAVPDKRKQARHLIDGDIDLCFDLPLDLHDELVSAGIEYREYLPYSFYAIAMNTRSTKLRDAEVRRALVRAVDRDAILGELLPPGSNHTEYAMWSPYPANADETLRRLPDLTPYDPEVARAVLETHGMSGNTVTLRYPDLLGETARLVAEQVADQWRACGLQVELTPVGAAFNDALRTGSFETALVMEDGFDRHYAIETLYSSNSPRNYTGVQSGDLDSLLRELRGAVTVMQKFPKCQQLNRLTATNPGYVYLFTLPSRMYYTSRLHGVDVLDPQAPLATLEHWVVD